MNLQFGDIQETALIPLAIKASETARPNARIKDEKAKEIIDALGVDVSKYDPFLSPMRAWWPERFCTGSS